MFMHIWDIHEDRCLWNLWRNFLSKIKESCFGEARYRVYFSIEKALRFYKENPNERDQRGSEIFGEYSWGCDKEGYINHQKFK